MTGKVEFALVQKDVLFGLQEGTKVLQAINKEMGGLEGVERLMGETEEARAYQEEISQMLAGRLSNQDEDEVEDELEALQHDLEGPVALPNAPVSLLAPKETEEETKKKSKERAEARGKEHAAAVPLVA